MMCAQVCDKSPKAALELLRSHRSQETGKTILQHLASSSQENVLFALSHAPGFLEDDTLTASWAGANWTYRLHFLDKPSARAFGDFIKHDMVKDLAQQHSLSCVNAHPSGNSIDSTLSSSRAGRAPNASPKELIVPYLLLLCVPSRAAHGAQQRHPRIQRQGPRGSVRGRGQQDGGRGGAGDRAAPAGLVPVPRLPHLGLADPGQRAREAHKDLLPGLEPVLLQVTPPK